MRMSQTIVTHSSHENQELLRETLLPSTTRKGLVRGQNWCLTKLAGQLLARHGYSHLIHKDNSQKKKKKEKKNSHFKLDKCSGD